MVCSRTLQGRRELNLPRGKEKLGYLYGRRGANYVSTFTPFGKLLIASSIMINSGVYLSQGSRLTFQLPSPVASDRFDSLAKTNF